MYSRTTLFIATTIMLIFGSRVHAANNAPECTPQDLPELPALPPVFQQGIFNFNPPGARSLGMGATFIGIADDATASEANPAGLTTLTKPEVSAHLRSASITAIDIDRDSSSLFTEDAEFTDSTFGLSFLSYARPLSERAAFSLYYQQAANLERDIEFSDGPAIRSRVLLEHLGISGAIKIGRWISLGASARYTRLNLEWASESLVSVDFGEDLGGIGMFQENIDDRDEDITFNAGLLLNPEGKFSLGIVYKQGADLSVEGLDQITDFFFILLPENLPIGPFDSQAEPFLGSFNVPDVFGSGFAFRPNQSWVIGVDLVRIRYSDIQAASLISDPLARPIRDETEVHIGTEYSFPLKKRNLTVSVRGGYYNNPDHDGNRFIDSEQDFITLGGGVKTGRGLQLDAAVAISDLTTEGILSFVWHLK